jgi:hypothetical protein
MVHSINSRQSLTYEDGADHNRHVRADAGRPTMLKTHCQERPARLTTPLFLREADTWLDPFCVLEYSREEGLFDPAPVSHS